MATVKVAKPQDLSAKALLARGGGFSFENCLRNSALTKLTGFRPPTATKTGTTIVGCVYKDGVVLGADTRSTAGPIVADKNCDKIHYIAPNIYCCGAGTAADTTQVTRMVSSQLEIFRLCHNQPNRVCQAVTRAKQHLYKYQGHVGAYLVMAGFDSTGPHLYTIWAHGSVDSLPFVTMGSGSLAAMAIFESDYRRGMSQKEAIDLVTRAILSGIKNDLGSGSNVDVCIINKAGGNKQRSVYKSKSEPRKFVVKYPKGATIILSRKKFPIQRASQDDDHKDGDDMEIES